MKYTFLITAILASSATCFAAPEMRWPANLYSDTLVPVSIEFDNIAGGQQLALNSTQYKNAVGDSFSVSLLQYFISNIELRKTDGGIYKVPQDSSYFLVKEADRASQYVRLHIPTGEYDQLSFVLGVDSLRNTMDVSRRSGVLDPAAGMNGMYWGWNSGYIFFKLEGSSPSAPADPTGQHKYRYHIGGFGGYSAPTINNIKKITIDLRSAGIVNAHEGRKSNIHLMVDILKAFNGPEQLSITNHPNVMFSEYSVKIADNYANMFRHDHTEN